MHPKDANVHTRKPFHSAHTMRAHTWVAAKQSPSMTNNHTTKVDQCRLCVVGQRPDTLVRRRAGDVMGQQCGHTVPKGI